MNDVIIKIGGTLFRLNQNLWQVKKFQMTDPEKKTALVSVPFRNGKLDCMSGLTENITYKNRKATITCKLARQTPGSALEQYLYLVSLIHNKTVQFNTYDDYLLTSFLYTGRAKVGTLSTGKDWSWTFPIEINTKPYATFYRRYSNYPEYDHAAVDGNVMVQTIAVTGNTGFKARGTIMTNNSVSSPLPFIYLTGGSDIISIGCSDGSSTGGWSAMLTTGGTTTTLNLGTGHPTGEKTEVEVQWNFMNSGTTSVRFEDGDYLAASLAPYTWTSGQRQLYLTASDSDYYFDIKDIWVSDGNDIITHRIPVTNTSQVSGLMDLVKNTILTSSYLTSEGDREQRRL